MAEQVTHIYQNQRYQIQLERGAVKGIDGYKVTANGDDMLQVIADADVLLKAAKALTEVKEE